ncbi:MAG: hydantoinase B/oxoprolinase family protein, partial [Alphaproteobacteria bacterium]|nr:hydantoinase B/oxoprolinase family protein [Alphaproteobacteria bacterium]
PNFPRACFARMAQIQRVLDCVIRALAPVIPARVNAGNSAHVMSVSYSGIRPGQNQYWVCVEVNEGSYGARADKDGLDAVDNLMANTRNVPCEEIELSYPLRVERYELRGDPPGAGKWRGGIGALREVRFLSDGFFSCNGDRTLEAPKGLFDGADGLPARVTRIDREGREENCRSKASGRKIAAGDVIRIEGPNAGGYGDPRARDPERVLADVLDGVLGVEAARETYGVAIDPARRCVDAEATRRLRG